MKKRHRPPIAFLVAVLCTVSAVGVPVHGHASHSGHDQPHVELAHHEHPSTYAQGDTRLIERAPRIAVAPTALPTVVPYEAIESRFEPPAPGEPVGRAPPDPSSPRAPPA